MTSFGFFGNIEQVTKSMLAEILSTTALVTLLTGKDDTTSLRSVRAEATQLLGSPLPNFSTEEWKRCLYDMVSKLIVVGRLLFEQAKSYAVSTQFEASAERLMKTLESQFRPRVEYA